MNRLTISIAAAALLVSACGKDKTAPPKLEGVSMEQAQVFAENLLTALTKCDNAAIAAAHDTDAMLKIAVTGSGLTVAERDGVIQGAKQSFEPAAQFCGPMQPDNHFKLLKVHEEGKTTRALYRVLSEDGVNYIDFVLGKTSADAPVRAHDYYIYMTGELMTETFRDLIGTMASPAERNSVFATSQAMQRARDMLMQQRYAEAKSELDSLSPALKKQKSIMLLQVQAAMHLDEATYEASITAFEKSFPDSPALDLVSIDGFVMREQWDDAMAAVERLDKRVGGDTYLMFLRANLFAAAKKYEKAKQSAEKALADEPTLVDAMWTLLTVALETQSFAEAAALLKRLETEFEVEMDPGVMAVEPLYAEFLQSDEYKTWLAGRGN
jgi:tetratricopeptide (TPR) repeat protein